MAEVKLTGTLRATHAIVSVMQAELVKGALLDAQHVARHKGRFDTKAELERFTKKNATVLVSALGTSNHSMRGGHTADISLVAFVVCRAVSVDMDAGMVCEQLSTRVTKLICKERWSIKDAAQAQNLKSNNLYSATLDGLGVSVWAISWTQNMSMEDVSIAELDDFLRFDMTNPIADGAPTLDAHVELEGVTNEGDAKTETRATCSSPENA